MSLLSFLGFGSGGNNSTETTTNQDYDLRDQSVNNAGDGILNNGSGSVSVVTTDHGAVQASINASVENFRTGVGFANNVVENAFKNNSTAMQTVASGQNAALQAVTGAANSTITAVKDAYSEAKAGEQKIMAAAALALVAIVAFTSVKG